MASFYDTYVQFGELFGPDVLFDQVVQTNLLIIFDESRGMGDRRALAFQRLDDHMKATYEFDFSEWFDWDDYKRWYERTQGWAA